jgi:hypothetical protein
MGRHAIGYRHAQVKRHPVELGVQGELVTGAGDELAHVELLGPPAHLDNHAGQ